MVGRRRYQFETLRELMGRATPLRSGDQLAGVAAESAEQRAAAQLCLADVPLRHFLTELVVPYESDSVTRLIIDTHLPDAFAPVADLTVGGLRDWLLRYETGTAELTAVGPGLTPEMVAAVAKIMGNQDLILAAKKCRVVTGFRNTLGLPGRLSVRLQPNHPTDDPKGIAASMVDGLLYGCGDAVIGINPATDRPDALDSLLRLVDDVIRRYEIPTQGCVLAHLTAQVEALGRGAPVDLLFQSIAGTEAANRSFGITLEMIAEGQAAVLAQRRGTVGDNVMYFETGQGSALSAGAHHGVDQQTLEARAYAVARRFSPLLVNSGRRLHRPRIPLRREADPARRAGGSLLREAARAANGGRRLLHQPCRGRQGRHGLAPDPPRGRGLQLHHGRPRLGRHHARLPVDLVSRRPVPAPGTGPAPGAGI
jgi:ethanolamine ammonia-lyase large subunit